MDLQLLERLRILLNEQGYARTTFAELNVGDLGRQKDHLIQSLELTDQFRDSELDGRTGMLMFRENDPLKCGRQLMEPVASALFVNEPTVLSLLNMYAVNRYDTGDFFNPHQDHFDGTVLITTIQGRRSFDIYRPEPEDDVFEVVMGSVQVDAGSVLLLNGYKNLGHGARCLIGPSISVVADVPIPL